MEIRIIPMSFKDDEFTGKNIQDVQKDFFKGNLIEKNKGWYFYGKKGLEAETGDLLLFQMDNSIIASARLSQVIKFARPDIDGNEGALVLERDTIKVFKPITNVELKQFIPGFIAFNQTKQKFNVNEVEIEALNKRMNEND